MPSDLGVPSLQALHAMRSEESMHLLVPAPSDNLLGYLKTNALPLVAQVLHQMIGATRR